MLTLSRFLVVCYLVAFAFLPLLLAQGDPSPLIAPEVPVDLTDRLTSFLVDLAFSHPWIVTLFGLIGFLRVIFKPAMGLLHGYVLTTQDRTDDEILEKVERSWAFAALSWALDFLGSVKLDTLKRAKGKLPSGTGLAPMLALVVAAAFLDGCATKAPQQLVTTRITYSTNGLDVVSPKDITFDSLELEDPTHGVRAKVKGYSSTASAAALRTAEAEQAGWMAQMQAMQAMVAQFGALAARAYGIPTGPIEPAPVPVPVPPATNAAPVVQPAK
jgi:hypothetical protein